MTVISTNKARELYESSDIVKNRTEKFNALVAEAIINGQDVAVLSNTDFGTSFQLFTSQGWIINYLSIGKHAVDITKSMYHE